MKFNDYPINICQLDDGDGGHYHFAWLPDFGWSACSATGDTPEEALTNLRDTYKVITEVYDEDGKTLPPPSLPPRGLRDDPKPLKESFYEWAKKIGPLPSSVMAVPGLRSPEEQDRPAFSPKLQEILKLGKYTRGYESLTEEQVAGLLWALGEWAIRGAPKPMDDDQSREAEAYRILKGFDDGKKLSRTGCARVRR
jgi:predicted RNase H-like HicB family nuclease